MLQPRWNASSAVVAKSEQISKASLKGFFAYGGCRHLVSSSLYSRACLPHVCADLQRATHQVMQPQQQIFAQGGASACFLELQVFVPASKASRSANYHGFLNMCASQSCHGRVWQQWHERRYVQGDTFAVHRQCGLTVTVDCSFVCWWPHWTPTPVLAYQYSFSLSLSLSLWICLSSTSWTGAAALL
jgi:hypothetical protein